MRSFQVLMCGLAALMLAGCGAGRSSLPSARDLAPGSIWVSFAVGTTIAIFPAGADGRITPSTVGFPWNIAPIDGVVAIASGADGTMWPLATNDAVEGGYEWRLVSIAPGATGETSANVYDGDGRPIAAALSSGGVMVESGPLLSGNTPVIRTYPYGAHDPPATRTFTTSAVHLRGFAIGPDGLMYIPRAHAFDVFPADSTGCCALKTISTASSPNAGFALGTDASIYAIELVNVQRPGGTLFVNVYAPGSGTLVRRIGPLPVIFDPLGQPPVIAVDRHDQVYVATNYSLYVFAAGADGHARPLHTITYQASDAVRVVAAGP